MENERSPMFKIALIVGVVSLLWFFIVAAAAGNGL